jgi:hypothetical protein
MTHFTKGTKIRLTAAGLILLAIALINFYPSEENRNHARERYAEFLHQKGAEMVGESNATPDDIPKPAHPDKAKLQDYFMTHDPKTGTVPKERLMQSYLSVKSNPQMRSNELLWEDTPVEMGGRTRALMYDPNDPQYKKVWAGGVTGGLWYRDDITDNNSQWQPVDDFWSSLNISCITYDPNDPQTFYVGTGESQTALIIYRESSGVGDGIWKSSDGGQTWILMESTLDFEYVNDIIIRNENGISIIYAGVVSGVYKGTIHYSEPSDGLFRSADGGMTWEQVLPNIPGEDYPYAPADIELGADGRIYVGTMQNVETEGGAVILYSDDGTAGSWTVFDDYVTTIENHGTYNIPGRVMITASPSDENVVYAAVAAGYINNSNNFTYYRGRYILKSTNKGQSWQSINIPNSDWATLAWHAFVIEVHPENPDVIFTGGLDLWKTPNSGNSWYHISDWSLMYYGGGDEYVHADHHTIAFNPENPDEFVCGSDGGVFYTASANNNYPVFEEKNQGYNTLQFYTGDIIPEPGGTLYCGGLQDNGTLLYQNQPLSINHMISGGDGAYCFFDDDDEVLITSVYYNSYYIFANWSFYDNFNDESGVFINPADFDTKNNTLFANRVSFTGSNANQLLRVKGIPYNRILQPVPLQTSTNVYFSHVKVSPYSSVGVSTLFIGTQTGRVYRVDNAQQTVPQVTEITSDEFPIAYVSCIAVGQTEDVLLVTFSNYGVESVWETVDGGQSWRNVTGNLPDFPVRWAIYHPQNDQQVMLATELGIWTTNFVAAQEVEWQQNAAGMANVRVDMLSLREYDNTVLAATHGRGLFTADYLLDPSVGTVEATTNQLSLFPNPSDGMVTIKTGSFENQVGEIRVMSLDGKVVYTTLFSGGIKTILDLSSLPKGNYVVNLTGENETFSGKVVLQ